MAIVVDGGGGDRKKPLHADLNLVPYIDLLTCMVAFLLITAVWTQLARLEVRQKGQGQEEGPALVDEMRVAVTVRASTPTRPTCRSSRRTRSRSTPWSRRWTWP